MASGKTNRDKLNSMALYDLLCGMNKRLMENDPNDETAETRACIMDCFMDSSESVQQCMCNCEKCIARFLNEEAE